MNPRKWNREQIAEALEATILFVGMFILTIIVISIFH